MSGFKPDSPVSELRWTGWVWQQTASSFMWNQPEGKKKIKIPKPVNQANNSKTNKGKATTKSWLKTKKEKYRAEQNSCAANNTGVFCFNAESSFHEKQNQIVSVCILSQDGFPDSRSMWATLFIWGSKHKNISRWKKAVSEKLCSTGVTWVPPYRFAIQQISPGTDANIWAFMSMVTFISLFLMPWRIED